MHDIDDETVDFKPVYLVALKTWLSLAGLVMFGIWAEATATGTLTEYLSFAAIVFGPGFIGTVVFIHLRPDKARLGALYGYLFLSGYFTTAFAFALVVGPWKYSFLVFCNSVWLCASFLYSSLFLGRRAQLINVIHASVLSILVIACLIRFKLEPQSLTGDQNYGVQPYVFSLMAAWVFLLGAKVINQLYTSMRASQKKVVLLRQLVTEMVGHEIGTPLQAIVNNIDLLDLLLAKSPQVQQPDPTPRAQRALQHLRRSVEQVQRVLDNAVASMNVSESVESAHPAQDEVNIHQMMEHIAEEFRPSAAARGLSISFNKDRPIPGDAVLDRTRVTQVLSNLVSNAIKYTDEGTILLSVSAPRQNEVEFVVADTGIGIPEAALSDIFEPYVRLPEAKSRGAEGRGLGLAVVKRELGVIGGRISVRSVHGQGSTFVCRLPASVRSFVLADPVPRSLRVLVVDDLATVVEAAYLVFADTHIICQSASNGAEALELLKETGFDLIFLDLQMPLVDGFEVARKLRGDESYAINKSTPIVAMSAAEPSGVAEMADWNFFLKKPFSFSLDLLDKVLNNALATGESRVPTERRAQSQHALSRSTAQAG